MTLPILVAQDRWQDFDEAWRERVGTAEGQGEMLAALRLAGEKNRISRCMALARETAKTFEEGGETKDAVHLLGTLLVSGGNPSELVDDVLRLAEAAYGAEVWWGPYSELTGLQAGAPDLRGPWRAFAKLCAFQPGSAVYHPGGWGAGEVLEVRPADLEVDVRFASGRKDSFPMTAAIDIFEPLAETDLRALYLRDAEGVRKRAKKEPLDALRRIVERHHGRASTTSIRTAMMTIGVEGSAWSAWWRKARKEAENSEWFDVLGSPQKGVVQLLLQAKDPAAVLRRQLELLSTLSEVNARVRELFIGGKVEEPIKVAGLEVLEVRAAVPDEPIGDRLAAWLLLRESSGETPSIAIEAIAELRGDGQPSDPSVAPALWRTFQELPSARDQERSVEVLREAYGDDWLDEVSANLQHAAGGMVRPLVDALSEAGRQADLRTHYAGLLARPLRAPALLVNLTRYFETPDADHTGLPTPIQRAHALINLATHLHRERRGSSSMTRISNRLTDTLTGGETPLLRRLLTEIDIPGLRSFQMLMQRGVDDAVDHLITDIALEHDRNFFAGESTKFWESETIWTTRSGLERRSGELRELQDVKIPENADAIGRAASYGDLSENAEWEAAMEEQRTLTARAMEIEDELRNVDLIENAVLPEDMVCPGTRVHYKETGSGEENQILILGPWDHGDGPLDIVSYRAPLAQGLLGLRPGELATVHLPSGELDVEVIGVELAEVD